MGFVGRFMQRLQHVLLSSEQPELHNPHQQALPMPPEDPVNGTALDLVSCAVSDARSVRGA